MQQSITVCSKVLQCAVQYCCRMQHSIAAECSTVLLQNAAKYCSGKVLLQNAAKYCSVQHSIVAECSSVLLSAANCKIVQTKLNSRGKLNWTEIYNSVILNYRVGNINTCQHGTWELSGSLETSDLHAARYQCWHLHMIHDSSYRQT